jgi:SAM-dependent methyltransferase
VLADVYSWLYGGFDAALARNAEFFAKLAVRPAKSGIAIDLGAGCGFQSIPLARLGFTVTAIDLDRKLLTELLAHAGDAAIDVVHDDLRDFDTHVTKPAELIVCMVDTLTHLDTKDAVVALIAKVYAALEPGGRFIVTYRDLSHELTELDRFIPVRSDSDTLFTCFLEYEPETVKVHDLVYRRRADSWQLLKGFYRKLRLAQRWVVDQLASAGFAPVNATVEQGFVTIVADR